MPACLLACWHAAGAIGRPPIAALWLRWLQKNRKSDKENERRKKRKCAPNMWKKCVTPKANKWCRWHWPSPKWAIIFLFVYNNVWVKKQKNKKNGRGNFKSGCFWSEENTEPLLRGSRKEAGSLLLNARSFSHTAWPASVTLTFFFTLIA